jgi:hypothetical protein
MKRTKIKTEKKIKNIYKRVEQKSSSEIPLESLAIHWESVWLSLQIMQTKRARTQFFRNYKWSQPQVLKLGMFPLSLVALSHLRTKSPTSKFLSEDEFESNQLFTICWC